MAPPTEEQLLHQSVVQYEVAKYNPLLPGENRSDSYLPTLNEQCRRSPIMQTENFDRFLKLYKARQVVVVNSDTGSEDSRQLVKRIMYLELNKGLKVVCTQAHEDAARELGQRVSAELEVKFGEQVGVQYRNYNKTSDRTRLYFVTEGMLRKQVGDNPNLAGYSCVILDFQGQTTNNNHLVGLLKQALALRFDLKLVIMAATESERLAIDFGVPKVVNLDEDSFSVVIQYMPEEVPHYCEMALSYVKRIHDEEGPGDILVFLGSAPQVDRAVATLRKAISDLETFPLHDRLSEKEKAEALQSSGETRRCVVTTNIAESDITVNGISYVVDKSIDLLIGVPRCNGHRESFWVKAYIEEKKYRVLIRHLCLQPEDSGVQMDTILNPRVGMETLRATLICKQSADQRAKCAGRTQSGICQRLYTIVKYNEVLPNVQSFEKLTDCFKTGLLALRISGADIKSIYTFDFIDPANEEVYLRGLENLRAMNLIDENGTMTPAGEAADKLPLSINPIWHNAFEEAIKLGCLSELIDIAALVSVKNICLIPPETLHAADVLHEQFMDPLSDHLSELNALYAYLHRKRNMSTEELAIWCHETFLNSASLEGALEMRQELIRWCKAELGVSEISFLTPHDKDYHVKIRKAIAKGFIHHAATKDVTCHQRQYITLENIPVILFYRSAIGTNWKWVVYHRIETTAPSLYCMDRCTVVEENWLLENDYFYPTNLPKDDNGKVRVKRIQILFDILNRPYQP